MEANAVRDPNGEKLSKVVRFYNVLPQNINKRMKTWLATPRSPPVENHVLLNVTDLTLKTSTD